MQHNGHFSALYDYKNDNFVVTQNEWSVLKFGNNNNFLEKYNGILAKFSIESGYEERDVYSYYNPITEEKIVKNFSLRDDNYYAILNIDGTIRGNKKVILFLKLCKLLI